jgi:hypothetical protein
MYWIYLQIERCEIYIISFWRAIGLYQVYLTVEGNAGMPENYRFMMDYEYQGKNKEIY